MNSENLNNTVEGQANNKNIAAKKNPITLIHDMLEIKSDEFKDALPRGLEGVDLERFIRSCKTIINKKPELVQCDRGSLMNALLECAFYGFLPNNDKGYFVAYQGSVSFQLGYKGCIDLLYRTNQIAVLDCMEVYKADYFKCEFGSEKSFKHIPALDKEDRGEIILFYVYTKLKNGQEKFTILTKKEVDIIKKSPKSGKVWNTHPVQMALKSVLIKYFKFSDLTPDMEKVLESDNEIGKKHENAIDTTSAPQEAEAV